MTQKGPKAKLAPERPAKSLKVPLVLENIRGCICTGCPVQADSGCVKERIGTIKGYLDTGRGDMPKPAGIPKLYCATGAASCKDIDTGQMCICGDCPVWKKCGLERATPTLYFCRDGKAV